jgi:hypothetical protein
MILLIQKYCVQTNLQYVRFEVFTATTMKNVVFWVVSLCGSCINRRLGGAYRLHLQGENNQRTKSTLAIIS